MSKPLWQFHLIGPYGTGCALVGRVHHCLADGPALMHVLLALTDAAPNAPRGLLRLRLCRPPLSQRAAPRYNSQNYWCNKGSISYSIPGIANGKEPQWARIRATRVWQLSRGVL